MRGRNEDGSFQEPFNPFKWGDAFTEGNSWHYTWSVFHDPKGLMNLMGGKEQFVAMLDSVFALPPKFDESYYGQVIHEIREMQIAGMGQYAHGNQPIQHMIYLYNYAGQPWKAQKHVREVMDRLYMPTPDGYTGDEDNGQTSAWYILSAMGFYSVAPASNQFVFGSPIFRKITLNLENGKQFTISAPNNNEKNIYIKDVQLNGDNLSKNWIDINTILDGGNLHFIMDEKPNKERGTDSEDAPYSFSEENDIK
jgi:predicted alpha-1,2-mannosidase